MKKNLHQVQEELLRILKDNFDDPLTIREIQEMLGVSSTSVVAHHLKQLEKKGYLKRNPSNPRDFQIITDGPEKLITFVNLYGLAHCGPSGKILDGDPIERVPISSKLLSFPADEAFMVRAKGNSMSPKINEGDLVIARKSSFADSGDVVVCINNEEALIKKIRKEKRGIILVSINPEVEPFLASEDLRIEGIVKGVLCYTN